MGEKKRDWKNTVIMLLIITSIILSILLLIVNMDIKEIIKKQPIAPEKGIVSYWSFDKNTIENNTIKDLRGQNNAKNFGADFTEKGRYYGAFNFDDNKDYIDCGNDPSLNIINNITISIWVKFSELTKNKEMINNNLFSLFHSSEESGNKIYFLYKVNIPKNAEKRYSCDSEIDSMTGVKTETEPRMNRWYNIVGVKSNDIISIYIDGKKEKELGNCFANGFNVDNSKITNLYLGKGSSNSAIDEVKIWRRALTPEEIAYLAGK